MIKTTFAIIEIGSNNTKLHIYEGTKEIYESTTTIEFKKNYHKEKKILEQDLDKLYQIIMKSLTYTKKIYIYGCSIFRNIKTEELNEINEALTRKFNTKIEVVSQDEEALLTAFGCYDTIPYHRDICIFIGGGGSIELIFVRDKKIINKKYYPFGVVDITKQFPSLKEDVPTVCFDEVYNYVKESIGSLENKADVLLLAGGDHLYWYNCAGYELLENTLYRSENQGYMLTREMSDTYDHDALVTSLNKIRENSDNPLWFDGSRAMKVITNLISHKIEAKYIVPTRINMETGLKEKILKETIKSS